MIRSILFVLVFSFLFNSATGQQKGDNAVRVHGFVSYHQVKEALFTNGFATANSDTLSIITTIKSLDWGARTGYRINRTDSSVIFIELSRSVSKKKLEFMYNMARSFGLPVSYFKEN